MRLIFQEYLYLNQFYNRNDRGRNGTLTGNCEALRKWFQY